MGNSARGGATCAPMGTPTIARTTRPVRVNERCDFNAGGLATRESSWCEPPVFSHSCCVIFVHGWSRRRWWCFNRGESMTRQLRDGEPQPCIRPKRCPPERDGRACAAPPPHSCGVSRHRQSTDGVRCFERNVTRMGKPSPSARCAGDDRNDRLGAQRTCDLVGECSSTGPLPQ